MVDGGLLHDSLWLGLVIDDQIIVFHVFTDEVHDRSYGVLAPIGNYHDVLCFDGRRGSYLGHLWILHDFW